MKGTIHHMRPGRVGGTQILCERPTGEHDYIAELSLRGSMKVDCPSCIGVLRELSNLYGFKLPAGMSERRRA